MLKKKIIFYCILILSVLMLILTSTLFYKNFMPIVYSNNCMKNECNFNSYSPFSINKIVYFSTANAESTINQNSSFTINNLYQITDIALSNINFNLSPNIGEPNLYYKNLNDFAKNTFDINNKIEHSIEFATTSENEIDFTSPVLYNNAANPITLSYVNSNIVNNFTLADDISNLSYDGNLLKACNITLNSIACKISFNMIIENNLDETYTCPMILNVPLSTENSTIYDGTLTLVDKVDYKFIKNN